MSLTQLRTVYEGLGGGAYRTGPLAPPNVGPSQDVQPRIPMDTPFASVPGPREPMPTTTQQNKKTNVQIPVARMSLKPIQEGSIVFVERSPHYHGEMGRAQQTPHHVVDLRSLNEYLLETTDRPLVDAATDTCADAADLAILGVGATTSAVGRCFPWRLDGVVNNSEMTAKPAFESSAVITNVAVQGPCRLLNNDEQQRCERRKAHPGSVVYVARWKRVYVPYALAPGSAREAQWRGFLAETIKPANQRDALQIRALEQQLRCVDCVSAFSSTQLSTDEYRVVEPDPTKHPYSAFVLDPNNPAQTYSLVPAVILEANAFALTALTGGAGAYRPFFGTGRLAGAWGLEVMVDLWKLGTTLDSNQAGPGMRGGVLTINVSIEHLPAFSAHDVDAIDRQSLIEGPEGWYHMLRVRTATSATPEDGRTEQPEIKKLLDKGDIVDPRLLKQVSDVIGSNQLPGAGATGPVAGVPVLQVLAVAGNDGLRKAQRWMFENLCRSPHTSSTTRTRLAALLLQQLRAMKSDFDPGAALEAERLAILREALVVDPHGVCRTMADEPFTNEAPHGGPNDKYGSLCRVPVHTAWGAAVTSGMLARLRGRSSLVEYLVNRWVLPTGRPLRLRKEPQDPTYAAGTTAALEASTSK